MTPPEIGFERRLWVFQSRSGSASPGPSRDARKSESPLETALGRDRLGHRRFRSKTVANRPHFPAKYAEPEMTPSEIGYQRRLWVFQSRSGSARPGPFRDARKSESPLENALRRDHSGRRRFRSKTVANRPLFPAKSAAPEMTLSETGFGWGVMSPTSVDVGVQVICESRFPSRCRATGGRKTGPSRPRAPPFES